MTMAEQYTGMSVGAATLIVNRHKQGLPTKALVLQTALAVLDRDKRKMQFTLPELPAFERARINEKLVFNLGVAIGEARAQTKQVQT
jgi:hypothetical protein